MILGVVAFIAGTPVTVQCDRNLGRYAKTKVIAVAPRTGSVIYVIPRVCVRDVHGAPFFTEQSVLVGRQTRDTTRLKPADYQIESCRASGRPGSS